MAINVEIFSEKKAIFTETDTDVQYGSGFCFENNINNI